MNSEKIFLKYKTQLMILSLLALIFTILGNMGFFVSYQRDFDNDGYKASLNFPSLGTLFQCLLSIIPTILLVLYILKFYGNSKTKIIFPILLWCIAFESLFSFIYVFSSNSIIDIVIMVTSILAAISSLKGAHSKKIIIVAAIIKILAYVYSLIHFFFNLDLYIEDKVYFLIFTNITYCIGTIIFWTAIIVFVLNNEIPIILHKKANQTRGISPEQELRLLKDKYEFGQITEEEYQTQRAEIINKL